MLFYNRGSGKSFCKHYKASHIWDRCHAVKRDG